MNKQLLKWAVPAVCMLSSISTMALATGVGSGVTITASPGVCDTDTTGGHAHATAFFNKRSIKNVIATNNEFQSQSGTPISQDTDLNFDVWESHVQIVGHGNDPDDVVSLPGTCIGSIRIQIPGGTNQSAQIAIEDYLRTPRKGQGVIVRTGQLDKRSKLDLYVDVKEPFIGRRHVVWNQHVGMPNPSGEMSIMRFERGTHYSCVNSGDTQGTLQFQVFDVDGNFRGVTEGCDSAPKSTHVTPDVTTLDYFDMGGSPVDVSGVIGSGFIKMTGRPNAANGGNASPFTSAVAIYVKQNPEKRNWFPFWGDFNLKLLDSTITFARRNAGNDTLDIGQ